MKALTGFEIEGKLLKTYSGPSFLLRFESEYENDFNPDKSIVTPGEFIKLIDELSEIGLEFIGCLTDRGVSRLINAYTNIINSRKGIRETLGFKNIYSVYFYNRYEPSGLIVLNTSLLIFIPGIDHPRRTLMIEITEPSEDERYHLTKLCRKYGLRWAGDPRYPILYREHGLAISLSTVRNFFLGVQRVYENL